MKNPVEYIPSAWRRHVHPRRGLPSADFTKVKADKKAPAKLSAHLQSMRSQLSVKAGGAKQQKAILAAVDAQIAGEAPTDALLAGAIGALAYYRIDYDAKPQPNAVVDQWAKSGGVSFAVDAALHAMSFSVGLKVKKEWSPKGDIVLREGNHEASAKSFDAPMFFEIANDARPALFRLRCMLATCSEDEYASAMAVAKPHRKKDTSLVGFVRRAGVSYLFPTERPWVEQDLRALKKEMAEYQDSETRCWRPTHLALLMACLRSIDDFETLNDIKPGKWPESPWDLSLGGVAGQYAPKRWQWMPTLLEGVGSGLLPLCLYLYDYSEKADYALAASAIPTDEAMSALMDRADTKHPMAALSAAVQRFPDRATRLLAKRVKGRGKNHQKLEPLIAVAAAAEELQEGEDSETKGVAKKGVAKKGVAKKTISGSAPALLQSPPWETRKPMTFKPVVLEPVTYAASFEWNEGEKDEFWNREWDDSELEPGEYLEVLQKGGWAPKEPWQTWTDEQWLGLNTDWEVCFRVARGPEHLSYARAEERSQHPEWFIDMGTAIVRYEDRLLPLIIEQATRHPKEAWVQLGPFDCAELAAPLASVLHVKKLRPDLEPWFVRHPRATAAGLIPQALGKDAKRRKAAVAALKVVARKSNAVVVEVARHYGDEVAETIIQLLADDPRLASQPNVPSVWTSALRGPVLRSGETLDAGALDNLRIFLMLSESDDPLPGLFEVLTAFDEDSLAAFGMALFEAWGRAGYPNDQKWVMAAQGFTGNDETARMLTPLVRKWPGEGGHVRATLGLKALADIGTDLALMAIYDIGQRVKFKALREMAARMVKVIAQERGLREEELADRLVPSLGLGESGMLGLDFGPRAFSVRFDETLKVQLRDADGKVLKSLPKPNKADDADKAKEAKQTLSALKKDVRAIAGSQIARLEGSMARARRWSAENFERFFAQHPLMRHLAQRLVWATYKGAKAKATFRPTDDGTYTNAKDEAFTLKPEEQVGIAHPLDMKKSELAAWGALFGDYEILQPFPQLGRTAYDTTSALALIAAIEGNTRATGEVLALTKVGWSRGEARDSGHVGEMIRVSTAGELRLELDPGFIAGAIGESPKQTLRGLFVDDARVDIAKLSTLSELERSELAWSLRSLG